MRILLMILQVGSLLIFSAEYHALCNSFFLVIQSNSFTEANSFDQSWSFQLCLQIFFVHLRDLSGTELCKEELFHFACHLLICGLAFVSCLEWDESVVERNDVHGGDLAWRSRVGFTIANLVIVAELLVLALLDGLPAQAVRDVGHQDECEEETEGQVGLPVLYFAVEQDDVEPDVGDDRPDGRDGEHACVLNFLDTQGSSIFLALLLSSLVVILIYRVNRDAGDNEEIKGGRSHDRGRA